MKKPRPEPAGKRPYCPPGGGRAVLLAVYTVFATLVPWGPAWAQPWSFATVRNKIEGLYGAKDWPGILSVGDSALRHGVDYARLRTCMGVAAYLTGRPFAAVVHLEKALALDAGDRLARTYLVYAYQATEREWDARRLAKKQDGAILAAMGLRKSTPLSELYLEGGARWSGVPDQIGPMPFGVVALGHRWLPELGLTHGFSYLTLDYRGTSLKQYDYFAQVPVAAARGIVLRPFGHFAWARGQASGSFQTPLANVDYSERIEQSNLIAGLACQVHVGRLSLKPMLAYGSQTDNIRTIEQIGYTVLDSSRSDTFFFRQTQTFLQANLGAAFTLPLWKNRLQISAEGLLHRTDTAVHHGWKAALRVQPLPRLYATLEYAQFPGMRNFVEADGIVLNNALNEIRQRVSLYGYFVFSPKTSLMLVGIWDQRRDNALDFQNYTFVTTLKFSL